VTDLHSSDGSGPEATGRGESETGQPNAFLTGAIARLASAPDVETAYAELQAILHEAQRVTDFSVTLYDEEAQTLTVSRRVGETSQKDLAAADSGLGIESRAIRERRTVRGLHDPGELPVIAVPLVAGGRVIGVLLAQRSPPRQFDGDDVSELEAVAGLFALTLHGALSRAKTEKHRDEMAILTAIASTTANKLRLPDILFATMERLRDLIPFTGGSIAIVEGSELVIHATVGPSDARTLGQRIKLGRDINSQVILERRSVLWNDASTDGIDQARPRSTLAVPLLWQGDCLGLLSIESPERDAFRPEHARVLEIVAGMLVGPIQSALVEERAAGERALLLATIESIPDGVWVFDAAGRVLQINDAGARQVGLAPADIIGHSMADLRSQVNFSYSDGCLVGENNLPSWRATHGEIVANERFVLRRAGDPDDTHVLCSAAPVRIDGQIRHAVLVATDVTRLHHLERAKEEFLAVASHELKTPVTTLRGQAQANLRYHARTGSLDEQRVLSSLETIIAQSDRLTILINSLLDVARLQEGPLSLRPSQVDLAALVQTVARRFGEQATSTRVQLRIASREVPLNGHNSDRMVANTEPVRAVVSADPDRLDFVLTHVIANALKYSPDRAPVEVILEIRDSHARVVVADRGIGVPKDDRERIFRPFQHGSNVSSHHYGGFGLGLYLGRIIVEASGGKIWVEDNPVGGARFAFELPLAAQSPA
jgi:PAS domain S-box-containing protein